MEPDHVLTDARHPPHVPLPRLPLAKLDNLPHNHQDRHQPTERTQPRPTLGETVAVNLDTDRQMEQLVEDVAERVRVPRVGDDVRPRIGVGSFPDRVGGGEGEGGEFGRGNVEGGGGLEAGDRVEEEDDKGGSGGGRDQLLSLKFKL